MYQRSFLIYDKQNLLCKFACFDLLATSLFANDLMEQTFLHFFVQSMNATEAPKKNRYLENFTYHQYLLRFVFTHPIERMSKYLGNQRHQK